MSGTSLLRSAGGAIAIIQNYYLKIIFNKFLEQEYVVYLKLVGLFITSGTYNYL